MPTPLNTSVNPQFISDGAGGTIARAETGPQVFGTRWEIDSVAISTTSTELVSSIFNMFVGSDSPSGFRGGSYSGDKDVDSSPNIVLQNLDRLICIWTGGTLGSYATAVITGKVVGR
jgi:hypothetical protein